MHTVAFCKYEEKQDDDPSTWHYKSEKIKVALTNGEITVYRLSESNVYQFVSACGHFTALCEPVGFIPDGF